MRDGDYLTEAAGLPSADFVIGNPPYVRLEDVPSDLAGYYRAAYPTIKGRADLYVAFFEAALRQLKDGGVRLHLRRPLDAQPLPRRAPPARHLGVCRRGRRRDARGGRLRLRGERVPGRDGHPQSRAARRRRRQRRPRREEGRARARERSVEDGGRGSGAPPRRSLGRESEYVVSRPRAVALHLAGEARAAQTARRAVPTTGVERDVHESRGRGRDGADKVFITSDEALVEESRLLPLAMAADISSGMLEWSGCYLVNPWGEEGLVDLGQYPRLKAYLNKHREALERRHIARRNGRSWVRTIDRVNSRLTGKPKLYVADIKDRLRPVLDRGETYPHHNMYFVQSDGWDLEVLGGLLLSDVAQFFIECYGVRMRGGYLRFQAQYLRRIRVPRPGDVTARQAQRLRRAFRERDAAAATEAALAVYGIEGIPPEVRSGY